MKVDDKRLQLRAQLTVDVDVDIVQDGSAPAIERGVVQDADGDQRRRRLHGPGPALKALELARHERLVLVHVEKGAAEVQEPDFALVMSAQHHGRYPGAGVAGRGRALGRVA